MLRKYSIALALILSFSITGFAAGVGDPAPDFTLQKLNGGNVTLSELQGRIVYIFWFGYN